MIKLFITCLLATALGISTQVSKALNSGDGAALAKEFHWSVELSILEEESVYSRTQAEQIMKKFFNAHPVVKYTTVHKGSSNDGAKFEIGTLSTKGNVSYRTYFLMKGKGNKQQIHQFRIESDE